MNDWRPDTRSAVPLYRQLADRLADEIRAGRLAVGDPLPSVRAMARDLLVSVITVGRAHDVLEAEGWITRRQGSGTFVAPKAPDDAREEARRALTDAVARARRLGLDADSVRSLVHRALLEVDDG